MSWGYSGRPDKPWEPKPFNPKRRVTYHDANEFARLRREGLTTEAISQICGIKRSTIEYHLRRFLSESEREKLRLACKRRGKLAQTKVERNAQLIEMRRQGHSIKEVSVAFGLSYRTTQMLLDRYLPIEETEALSLRPDPWDPSDPVVLAGLEYHRSGMPIRAAAKKAGLPASSLFRAIKRARKAA